MQDEDRLINSAEAKRLVGNVSDMTLRRWEAKGIIPKGIYIRKRKYWKYQEFIGALHAASEQSTKPESPARYRKDRVAPGSA